MAHQLHGGLDYFRHLGYTERETMTELDVVLLLAGGIFIVWLLEVLT